MPTQSYVLLIDFRNQVNKNALRRFCAIIVPEMINLFRFLQMERNDEHFCAILELTEVSQKALDVTLFYQVYSFRSL